jgi:hypothetical protein
MFNLFSNRLFTILEKEKLFADWKKIILSVFLPYFKVFFKSIETSISLYFIIVKSLVSRDI